MPDAKITSLTADTTPTSDDLVVTVNDPAGTPANRKATLRDIQLAGSVVQVVNTTSSAAATGTTTIPRDNSIPQNTEGTEFITLAITPKSTTNILIIDAVILLANDAAGSNALAIALFQDTTASALAAAEIVQPQNSPAMINLRHAMAAGTTSSTTFKIRGGCNTAGTTTFNGAGGGALYGAITYSSIVITEYKA